MKLTEVYILKEAACPLCGDKNAYQGFNSIECSTQGCKNFSNKQQSDSDADVDYRKYYHDTIADKKRYFVWKARFEGPVFEAYDNIDGALDSVLDDTLSDYEEEKLKFRSKLIKDGLVDIYDDEIFDLQNSSSKKHLESCINDFINDL